MVGRALLAVVCLAVFFLAISHSALAGVEVAATSQEFRQGASPDKYPYLSGGRFVSGPVTTSPDPLINYVWDDTRNTSLLQVYHAHGVYAAIVEGDAKDFTDYESLSSDTVNVGVHGPGEIIVDFGVERAGWLEIESPDLGDLLDAGSVSLKLGIGEYAAVGIYNSGPSHPVKQDAPTRASKTSSVYRLILNDEWYEGVRYGIITVTYPGVDRPSFTITAARLVCQVSPINYMGSLTSSDEEISRIWYTGAYTMRLNILPSGFGAILMDRGDRISWCGDAFTSQLSAMVVFGPNGYARVSDNIIRTHGPQGYNGIESYAIYWVLSVCEYYWRTGDKAILSKFMDEIETKLSHARDVFLTNPNLSFFGTDERTGAMFIEASCPESQRAYSMLSIRAHSAYASACVAAGEQGKADEMNGHAADLWQKYASHNGDKWWTAMGLHSAAEAILSKSAPDEALDHFRSTLLSDTIQICSFAPFNMYFIISAMWTAGMKDETVAAIRRCWGGQLDMGATTFWENYSPEWNSLIEHPAGRTAPIPNGATGYTSMCHPWGSGVTAFLSDYILGVLPTSPGYATYEVQAPFSRDGRLLVKGGHLSGTVPTPFGDINVSWNTTFPTQRGLYTVFVDAPASTHGWLVIPSGTDRVLSSAGNVLWSRGGMRRVPSRIMLDEGAQNGIHIYMDYHEARSLNSVGERQYPGKFVGVDNSTKGGWLGVYGKDSATIFSNTPAQSLFTGAVKSISWKATGSGDWAVNSTDARALQAIPGSSGMTFGAISTKNPIACQQTFSVDIEIAEPGTEYTVALYFVDWDNAGRDLIVEPHDLDTKNIFAPFQRVRDYSEGIYLIFSYTRSMRFRVSHIRGADATLSGVFVSSASAPTAK